MCSKYGKEVPLMCSYSFLYDAFCIDNSPAYLLAFLNFKNDLNTIGMSRLTAD